MLRSQLKSEEENEWNNKPSVLALMSTAGKGTMSSDFSIKESLQYFTVGTDLPFTVRTDLSKRSPGRGQMLRIWLGRLLRKVVVYQQPAKVAKWKLEHEDPLSKKDRTFDFSDEMEFPSKLPLGMLLTILTSVEHPAKVSNSLIFGRNWTIDGQVVKIQVSPLSRQLMRSLRATPVLLWTGSLVTGISWRHCMDGSSIWLSRPLFLCCIESSEGQAKGTEPWMGEGISSDNIHIADDSYKYIIVSSAASY